MVTRTYSDVLSFCIATNAEETEQIFEQLPAVVTDDLARELEASGEALRFDLESQRAFAFGKQDAGVAYWVWSDVRTYDEASRLLAAVVDVDGRLNAQLANELYASATNRQITLQEPKRARPPASD
jgi:hypothetical protein